MAFISLLIIDLALMGIGIGLIILLLTLIAIAFVGILSAIIIKLVRHSHIKKNREVHKASLIISNVLLVIGIICAIPVALIIGGLCL